MNAASAEARRLLEERAAARAAHDFASADRLRDRLREMGWLVIDEPQGSRLASLLDQVEAYARSSDAGSRLGAADSHEFSVCVVMAGWPEDVGRLVSALAEAETGPALVEVVVVDQARSGARPRDLAATQASALLVRVLRVDEDLGYAQAWNLAAHQAGGRVLVFTEPSLEFGPEVLEALGGALEDPAVGLAGGFGLQRRDEHHFEPTEGPEVDALEYLLAIRRADFARAGDFDPHFRFYRMLDIDFSHQVRAAGLKVRRVPCPSIRRHEHRLWTATPEVERERLSRRNFNRFLERWVRTARGQGR
jgi:GT2 family glycosyltransferase